MRLRRGENRATIASDPPVAARSCELTLELPRDTCAVRVQMLGPVDTGPCRFINWPRRQHMKAGKRVSLNLEVQEIEKREKAGGHCSSSTTHRGCTCACRPPTTGL